MKSLDEKQDAANIKPDLVTRSYSPLLRVLVVGAIFVVAVFVLAACGSKTKTATSSTSTSTQSTVATPSASTTVASAQTCKADTSSDSINVATYFGNVLTQVKKDWRPDAKITSVRFEDRNAKNFNSLCSLRTDGNWKLILFSASSKTYLVADLDTFNKKSTDMPLVRYEVVKKLTDNSESYTGLTIADMKKQGGWSFFANPQDVTAATDAKGPDNPFLTWKITMSQVIQKFIDRTRTEKITGMGYNILIGNSSIKNKSPYAYIYWENGAKKTAFYVETVTLTSYDYKY
jgi:hypothetical protein